MLCIPFNWERSNENNVSSMGSMAKANKTVSMVSSTCLISLTHWGRVTHICASKLTISGSDNGLSPDRRQAIIWTNDGILLIGPLGTNFSEILIETHAFSFKKMHLKNVVWKMAAILSRPQCVKCCSFSHRPLAKVEPNTFCSILSNIFQLYA